MNGQITRTELPCLKSFATYKNSEIAFFVGCKRRKSVFSTYKIGVNSCFVGYKCRNYSVSDLQKLQK
jgi:hypothetical protein